MKDRNSDLFIYNSRSMKHLYLLRHGQTEFNLKVLSQGQVNSPLTELGIKQAEVIKEEIKKLNLKFDYVFSSPLGRSIETMNIVLDNPKHELLDGLKEISFGSYDGKDWYSIPRPLATEKAKEYGGETIDELLDRVYKSIVDVMNKVPDNSNVIIFSHGFAIRTFDNYVTGDLDNKYFPSNCSIYVYEYDGDSFKKVDVIQNPISKSNKE